VPVGTFLVASTIELFLYDRRHPSIIFGRRVVAWKPGLIEVTVARSTPLQVCLTEKRKKHAYGVTVPYIARFSVTRQRRGYKPLERDRSISEDHYHGIEYYLKWHLLVEILALITSQQPNKPRIRMTTLNVGPNSARIINRRLTTSIALRRRSEFNIDDTELRIFEESRPTKKSA
jgi:hypothetical protein